MRKNSPLAKLLLVMKAAVLLVVANSVMAISVKQCFTDAKTELEKSYCKILEKGQTLPEFYAFQRNPSSTQRLLLTTPARKAGITLPDERSTTTNDKLDLQNAAPTFSKQSNSDSDNTPAPTPLPRRASASRPAESDTSFAKCTLDSKEIRCPQGRYFLAINLPLKRLNSRVLDGDNQLTFPARRQNQSSLQYLSSLYPNYIEKMLLIGLGDSTLSFTKFAALYEQAQNDSERFSQRFKEMYELLKSERKTMGIKTRYRENYPASLEACMRLSDELIACDDIKQNWVYKRLRNN